LLAIEGEERMVTRISETELPRKVEQILNQIRSKGNRFLVEQHGIPVAAVVSVEDLENLERVNQERRPDKAARLVGLARADELCQQILARRNGAPLPDSTTLIHQLREERDGELDASLH
jgi:PHD/YefM family antitoxin component YafN of YafNO toxin-antitoxin module